MRVPRHTLAPGYDIARIVIGGWQLSAGHTPRTIDRAALTTTFQSLIEQGFTTFDCADIYTGVEALFGELRHTLPAELRHSVQIHTKFVPDRNDLRSLDKAHVQRIIDRSLERLRCDRLDLVQLAWWDYQIPGWTEAAGHLVDLQRAGKIHHIGVTNFNTTTLNDLLVAGTPVVANQVQYSALDRRPAGRTLSLCRRHNIGLVCYGTLAGGFLSERFLGQAEPRAPFENRSLTKYRLIIDEAGGWAAFQELLTTLAGIARRHRVGISSVAARYVLEREGVAAAIIGTRGAAHIDAMLETSSFPFDAEDAERIGAWSQAHGGPAGDVFDLERDPEGPHGRIMRYNLNAGEAVEP